MGLSIYSYASRVPPKKKHKNPTWIVFRFSFPTRAVNYSQNAIFPPSMPTDTLTESYKFCVVVGTNCKKPIWSWIYDFCGPWKELYATDFAFSRVKKLIECLSKTPNPLDRSTVFICKQSLIDCLKMTYSHTHHQQYRKDLMVILLLKGKALWKPEQNV